LSKGDKNPQSASSNIRERGSNSSPADISPGQDGAIKAIDDDVITITNHKNTIQSIIEKSPLGVQFAIIVLFYLARGSMTSTSKSITDERSREDRDLLPFSFTSREFSDAYSQLAIDMGLTRYLLRHMAFAEYMLTIEYLVLVREDEITSNYHFTVNFEDLKWLASLAFQHIAGGQGLSSPEIFYPSHRSRNLSSETGEPSKIVNHSTMSNTSRTDELIKDLSKSIFSRGEIELDSSGGSSRSQDDSVGPRNKDYGVHRPFFAHRVPPTMYRLRKPDDGEWKRIIREFFEGQKCLTCNVEVLPQQFEVWVGEAVEDNAIPYSKRDQRMTELLAEIDGINPNRETGDDESFLVASAVEQQNIDPEKNIIDRALLIHNYGVIPMDGKDAFIAFAKAKLSCPNCGTNPSNSVSLMPKY
jgi:hypothetical protein